MHTKSFGSWIKNIDDPDVIWTRNLLIWSQTRYRCATKPATIRHNMSINMIYVDVPSALHNQVIYANYDNMGYENKSSPDGDTNV